MKVENKIKLEVTPMEATAIYELAMEKAGKLERKHKRLGDSVLQENEYMIEACANIIFALEKPVQLGLL